MTLDHLRGSHVATMMLGLAFTIVLLFWPISAPAPGDHEDMTCGSIIFPVQRDVSRMESYYREPTIRRCADARTARGVWAALAFGAAGTAAFVGLRRRRQPATLD